MKKQYLTFSVLAAASVAIAAAGLSFSNNCVFNSVKASSSYSVIFDKNSIDTGEQNKTDQGIYVYSKTKDGNNVLMGLKYNSANGISFPQARTLGLLAKKASADNNFHIRVLTAITGLKITNVQLYKIKSVTVDYEVIKEHEGTSYSNVQLDFRPEYIDADVTWACVISDFQPNVAYTPDQGTATNKNDKYSAFDINFYGNQEININSVTVTYQCSIQ